MRDTSLAFPQQSKTFRYIERRNKYTEKLNVLLQNDCSWSAIFFFLLIDTMSAIWKTRALENHKYIRSPQKWNILHFLNGKRSQDNLQSTKKRAFGTCKAERHFLARIVFKIAFQAWFQTIYDPAVKKLILFRLILNFTFKHFNFGKGVGVY